MKLQFRREPLQFVDRLDAKQYRQVMRAIMGLLRDATPHDSETLVGHRELRRLTVGELRVIYQVLDDTVVIQVVGRRNDDAVYRAAMRGR